MAPPSNRRPGFSRKAQYGVFLGYVVAVAGILFAVLLLVIAAVDPRGFTAIRGAALDATAPISAAGRSVVGFFGGIVGNVSDYIRAGSQNSELRRELDEARWHLTAAQAAEFENRRLRQLLGLARDVQDEVTIAEIVGSSYASNRRYATLSAGSQSGVEAGQPVRAPDGLIGRILETGRWASRVLLVTDAGSNVPVRLVRDGTPGLAVGRGDGTIVVRTLEVGSNQLRPGDLFVTSGIGGIFPPNVPVAEIVRIEDEMAIARPVADPARADFAIVQRAFQPAAAGGLDQAAPMQTEPVTVTGPPPAVTGQPKTTTPPPRQRSPDYQPALQRPQAPVKTRPAQEPRR
jgi:rod shape-determining protein MreC